MSARFEVGQRVWVYRTYGRDAGNREPIEATVTKVGRTLVTVDDGSWRSEQYRMETGYINGAFSHSHIRTDEQRADVERRSVPLAYLTSIRVHDLPSTLSTDALEQIVAIIKADIEPTP